MNILHIAYSLSESSAATRLAYSQYENKDNVYFLLGEKSSYKFVRERQYSNRIYFFFSFLSRVAYKIMKVLSGISSNEVFSFEIFDIYNKYFINKIIKKNNIDIIHFHWCGAGFFSLKSISELNYCKIVITFHDYHLSTGGCHIPMGCVNFSSCIKCPLVSKNRLLTPLFHYLIKQRKQIFYSLSRKKNIRFISPSKYTYNILSNSIHAQKHFLIGNVLSQNYYQIDTNTFIDNFNANMGDKRNILFVSIKKSKRDNKGFIYMSKIIDKAIENNWPVHFHFVASDLPEKISFINYTSHGYLSDNALISLYTSSDLCVIPSRYETFSQVCLESILCCTPIIAFDLTGPNDIVSGEFPFFLVNAFDELQFIEKTYELLDYKRNHLLSICQKKDSIKLNYSSSRIFLLHNSVYKSFYLS